MAVAPQLSGLLGPLHGKASKRPATFPTAVINAHGPGHRVVPVNKRGCSTESSSPREPPVVSAWVNPMRTLIIRLRLYLFPRLLKLQHCLQRLLLP